MKKEKSIPELRFPEFSGEWEEARLKDLGNYGKSYSYARSKEGKGDYFHIHYGDIHSKHNGYITKKSDVPSIISNKEHELLKSGDIVVADASEDYKDLGKTLVIKDISNKQIIAGLHTFKFTPNEKLNPIYYLYYTQTDIYRKFTSITGTGTSVYGISKTNLGKMKILLPSASEQQKIGDFLSALDSRIELQDKKIEKLEEKKKGLMQKIFKQEIRFKDENGEYYPEWEKDEMSKFIQVQGGNAFKSNKYTEIGIPIIRISNIDYEINLDKDIVYYPEINIEKKFRIQNGDLLIAMSGATTGKTGIYKNKNIAYLNQRVGKFKPINDELYYSYLYQLVSSGIFKNKLSTRLVAGAQPNISSRDIEGLMFKFPCYDEQKKIADFLSLADKKIEKEKEKLEGLKKKKKGLLQKMFV